LKLPTNYHSIGGLYSAASFYCFGNMDDAGKLMGLAPYGKLNGKPALFILKNGTVEVDYSNLAGFFTHPAAGYDSFKSNFQHYADIARWVQHEAEKAIEYIFKSRLEGLPAAKVAYAGGVALNAVANSQRKQNGRLAQFFPLPAAGDNGLALGCAYYGWLAHLKQSKVAPTGSPFLGRPYSPEEIKQAIREYEAKHSLKIYYSRQPDFIRKTAGLLAEGSVIAWYQGGAEFGPRALGHRSILADPRKAEIKNHINSRIKFREDFRPFAPAVRKENAGTYFRKGWESPYMILIDWIKPEWKAILPGIVHQDDSCRVQTVSPEWNNRFYELLGEFETAAGIGVLLNTSLNKRGMPIVETPAEALDFFFSCALDVLVMEDFIIEKA
ncbi:MAG TPA: carbamoyltransferase C-terminal domain-containing protein, partial [Anseongella sp.]|nr:carbamoyltransferase C-terminal domain-containing protein [Anseongella sp.]